MRMCFWCCFLDLDVGTQDVGNNSMIFWMWISWDEGCWEQFGDFFLDVGTQDVGSNSMIFVFWIWTFFLSNGCRRADFVTLRIL